MSFPPDYLDLLAALAKAFTAYHDRTGFMPVLVGGGATAILTAGAFMSGDLDVIAPDNDAFHAVMLASGFLVEGRPARLRGGYYHPAYVRYGVELVSGQLFDGRAEQSRMIRMVVRRDDGLLLPSFEDLIADRLAQHAVASPDDDSRLMQAQLLYDLAETIDQNYLHRRIEEEGGDIALLRPRGGAPS